MADADSLASFLGVGRNGIPADLEQLDDPEEEMVNLARRSWCLEVKRGMVPWYKVPAPHKEVGKATRSALTSEADK